MAKRCDLCSAVPAVVQYPALDFIVGGAGRPLASRGSWLACLACDRLLRREDRDALRRRALRLVGPRYPTLERTRLEALLGAILDQFLMHRTGEPRPVNAA